MSIRKRTMAATNLARVPRSPRFGAEPDESGESVMIGKLGKVSQGGQAGIRGP